MPNDWKKGYLEDNHDNVQHMLWISKTIDCNVLLVAVACVILAYLIWNPNLFRDLLYCLQRRLYRLRFRFRNIQNRFSRFLGNIQEVRIPYIWLRNFRAWGGFALVAFLGFCHIINFYRSFFISIESSGFVNRISYTTSFLYELMFLWTSRYYHNGRIAYRTNILSLGAIPGFIILFNNRLWNRLYFIPILVSYVSLWVQCRNMLRELVPIDARPSNGEVSPMPRRIIRPFGNLPVFVIIMEEEEPEGQDEPEGQEERDGQEEPNED